MGTPNYHTMFTNTPMTRFNSEASHFLKFVAGCILLTASLLCITTYNERRRRLVKISFVNGLGGLKVAQPVSARPSSQWKGEKQEKAYLKAPHVFTDEPRKP